jgi:hypothetical protein
MVREQTFLSRHLAIQILSRRDVDSAQIGVHEWMFPTIDAAWTEEQSNLKTKGGVREYPGVVYVQTRISTQFILRRIYIANSHRSSARTEVPHRIKNTALLLCK